jgi:hypothetical protein
MDHNEAIRQMAAERYVLNELAPEFRRSFEEHLFECEECELDLQSAYALIDGSKQVFSAAPAVEAVKDNVKPSRWAAWLRPAFTVPVMAGLVVFAGYQNFVTVPQLKGAVAAAHVPQLLTPVYLTAGTSRGSESLVKVTSKKNYLVPLTLDIPTESRFTSYVCEIESPSGELEGSLPVSAEAARNSVSVTMYPKGNSGTYQLVVFGVSHDGTQRVEIERQSFEIQVQE